MPDSTDPQAQELIEFINEELTKPIDHPEFDLGIEVPLMPRAKGQWVHGNPVLDIIGPPKPPYRPEGHIERIAGLIVEDIPEGKGLDQRSEAQRAIERGQPLKPGPLTSDEWPPRIMLPVHTKPPPKCFCGARFATWEECFAHRHEGRDKIVHFRFRGKS